MPDSIRTPRRSTPFAQPVNPQCRAARLLRDGRTIGTAIQDLGNDRRRTSGRPWTTREDLSSRSERRLSRAPRRCEPVAQGAPSHGRRHCERRGRFLPPRRGDRCQRSGGRGGVPGARRAVGAGARRRPLAAPGGRRGHAGHGPGRPGRRGRPAGARVHGRGLRPLGRCGGHRRGRCAPARGQRRLPRHQERHRRRPRAGRRAHHRAGPPAGDHGRRGHVDLEHPATAGGPPWGAPGTRRRPGRRCTSRIWQP
jgi:hypothetical protein